MHALLNFHASLFARLSLPPHCQLFRTGAFINTVVDMRICTGARPGAAAAEAAPEAAVAAGAGTGGGTAGTATPALTSAMAAAL